MTNSARMTRAAFGSALTLLVLGLSPAVGSAQEADDETVREGRALFESQQCWQCHGYEGQGGAARRSYRARRSTLSRHSRGWCGIPTSCRRIRPTYSVTNSFG